MATDDLSSSITSDASRRESRRSFLRHGALAALAGTALAACKPSTAQQAQTAAPASAAGSAGRPDNNVARSSAVMAPLANRLASHEREVSSGRGLMNTQDCRRSSRKCTAR